MERFSRTAIFSVVAHIKARRKQFYWRVAARKCSRAADSIATVVELNRVWTPVTCLQRRQGRNQPLAPETRSRGNEQRNSRNVWEVLELREHAAPLHILPSKRPPVLQTEQQLSASLLHGRLEYETHPNVKNTEIKASVLWFNLNPQVKIRNQSPFQHVRI